MTRHVEDYLSHRPTSAHESLGPEQCDRVAAAVVELLPDWSVELHHDELRKPMIVIQPENLDDAIGPTLIIYRDKAAFHLEELRWDTYRKLGHYRLWANVLRAVRINLIWETPFPTTLH